MADYRMTPFGTLARVDTSPGAGDLTLGPFVSAPRARPRSVEHELFHAGLQSSRAGMGALVDALLGNASNFAYGPQAAYRNPTERAAYGYQEAVTGQPDPLFQSSSSPEMVAGLPQSNPRMIVRNLLDVLGDAAEWGGRKMGGTK